MKIENIKELVASVRTELIANNLFCLIDIMTCLPKEYRDFSKITPLEKTIDGEVYVIQGKVISIQPMKYPIKTLSFVLLESTYQTCKIIFFSASNYLKSLIKINRVIRCAGVIRVVGSNKQMLHPNIRIGEFIPEFMPIYRPYGNIKIRSILEKIKHYKLDEYIPNILLEKYNLPNINQAFQDIHFPSQVEEKDLIISLERAYRRIALEEIIAHYTAIQSNQQAKNNAKFHHINIDESAAAKLIASFAFSLTKSQEKVIAEIFDDFKQKNKPLSRLIQGDVGSGKTVIMLTTALQVAMNGKQSVILAPTSILAEQHYKTFQQYFAQFDIPVVLLAGFISKAEVNKANKTIAEHANCVIVGTHAVFQSKTVQYQDIGLIITDEQQRFGVEQRQSLYLRSKLQSSMIPHNLIVTATPIPRTLSLCFYNMLDISTIDELPKSRKEVKTSLIGSHQRNELIKKVDQYIKKDNQVYWVCPFISDEKNLGKPALLSVFKGLRNALTCKIGMLHGRMKECEKSAVISSFRKGELDLLVTTTIVEVGVDIPNANVMIIEDADTLGLSQLHQLRGRIGRGEKTGYCILLYSDRQRQSKLEKLMIIRNNSDGFKIAEQDLLMRGSGNILGDQQAGRGQFKITNWRDIPDILPEAIDIAKKLSTEQLKGILERWLNDEK